MYNGTHILDIRVEMLRTSVDDHEYECGEEFISTGRPLLTQPQSREESQTTLRDTVELVLRSFLIIHRP